MLQSICFLFDSFLTIPIFGNFILRNLCCNCINSPQIVAVYQKWEIIFDNILMSFFGVTVSQVGCNVC